MLKLVFRFIKRIVVSFLLLYSFNLIISPLSVNIPINLYTITILTLLEMPGLIMLIATMFFIL